MLMKVKKNNMKTVIMAGGFGSRLSEICNGLPKPLVKIDGVPILEREIDCLREQGFTDIILTVSYKAEMIIDYFGDGSKISPITGQPFGVNIEYFIEKEPLGNAGALFKIKDRLTDDFLLLNADSLFDIDFNRFLNFHYEHNALVTLFAHPNNHPYDSGLLVTDEKNIVKNWLNKEDDRPKYYRNLVNAGLHILSKKVLNDFIFKDKIDLDRDIIKPNIKTNRIFAYISSEYVKDMGTSKRFYEVEEDIKSGKVSRKSFLNKQKAIFLDRDGTINKYVGFLRDVNELELLPKVADAVKLINKSDYLAIVVTNQPVIARGEVTIEQLNDIHNKMETLLGDEGAYLDAIYYCPHHPDKGFEGEVPELKINCDCRKPGIGLLKKAANDFNIDLTKSWMVGDSETDILCGNKANCKTALIKNEEHKTESNITKSTLFDIIKTILGEE